MQDFEGFKNLFGKFINSTGPSVNWDKIEKLPQESVSKIAIIIHNIYVMIYLHKRLLCMIIDFYT